MEFYILLTLLPLAIGIHRVDPPATAAASPIKPVTAPSRVAELYPSIPPPPSPRTFNFPAVAQTAGGVYSGSTMLGYFLTKLVDSGKKEKYGCTIVITNTMKTYNLINPTVFLTRGSTRDPPPYKIEGSPDGSKTQFVAFAADDEFGKFSFVSQGVLTYEIENAGQIFSIAWKVERNGPLSPGAGTNSFAFEFGPVKKLDQKDLKNMIEKISHNAASVGGYVEEAEEYKGEIKVRAHMTNSEDAKLIVSIEDTEKSVVLHAVKRDFAATMTSSVLSTVAGVLTTTALRYLPFQTQVIIVTLENDFKAVTLEDPKWHLKNVIIHDSIPFEIAPQDKKQVTFRVPFAYGEKLGDKFKTAAVVVTFKIRGGDKRLALAIWWRKKKPYSGFNEYSAFLIAEGVGNGELQNIADGQNSQIERLSASKFQKYVCVDDSYTVMKTKTLGVTLMTIMGDSSESGMKVHISDRAMGTNPNQMRPSPFYDCSRLIESAVL